jgi:hypothetical protein
MSAKDLHPWDDSFWLANKILLKSVTLKALCIFNRIFFLHQIAYASSGYHRWSCEFASRSGEVCSMQHTLCDKVHQWRSMSVVFFGYSWFIHQLSSPLRYNDMTEILLTVALKHTPLFSSYCFCNMSKLYLRFTYQQRCPENEKHNSDCYDKDHHVSVCGSGDSVCIKKNTTCNRIPAHTIHGQNIC